MGYFSPGAYGGVPPGAYGGMIHPAALALHSILSRYGGLMNPTPGAGQGYWTPAAQAAARPMPMGRPGGPLMNVGAMLPPVGGQAGGMAPAAPAGGLAPGTAPAGVGAAGTTNPTQTPAGYWTPERMQKAQGL